MNRPSSRQIEGGSRHARRRLNIDWIFVERESGLTRVVETWFPGHMILPFVAMVVMVGGGGRWPDGGLVVDRVGGR